MKAIYLLLIILISSLTIKSQNYYFCYCILKYDWGKENVIMNESEIPPSIIQQTKNIFKDHPNYYKSLVFEKAHVKGNKLSNTNDSNKTVYEALYHLNIPDKITQGTRYCVIISLDLLGNSTQFLNLPNDSLDPQEIISMKKAKRICKYLWASKKEKVHGRLEFDQDRKIIVWCLERFVNRTGLFSGLVLDIRINAFNGEIIENKQAYHEVKF